MKMTDAQRLFTDKLRATADAISRDLSQPLSQAA